MMSAAVNFRVVLLTLVLLTAASVYSVQQQNHADSHSTFARSLWDDLRTVLRNGWRPYYVQGRTSQQGTFENAEDRMSAPSVNTYSGHSADPEAVQTNTVGDLSEKMGEGTRPESEDDDVEGRYYLNFNSKFCR